MKNSKTFEKGATIVLLFIVIITFIPIALIIIGSFTDEKVLLRNGYSFIPQKLSINAYYYLYKQGAVILHAYFISIVVTGVGTIVGVLISAMLAYPMSRKTFKYRNVLSFFVFFTMLFNGGIVPSYILWSKYLHATNTIWALILPNYLVTAFNVILLKNYYSNNIPDSLIEAAQIDGASEAITFFKLVLPLAIPSIATVSLFSGLCYWNDWINGLYYINNEKLYTIQMLLMKIMNNIQAMKTNTNASLVGTGAVSLPGFSIRMAMAFIGILPILIIYPFVQKYLIKGVVIGAVKG